VADSDFLIKTFDLLPTFRVPLTIDDAPLDLTNAVSVYFIMRSAMRPAGSIIVNSLATIELPKTSGIISYDWVSGDTDVPGIFYAEAEIHWNLGKPQTAPTDSYWTIEIRADLDGAA
jgi:hypothetical protein